MIKTNILIGSLLLFISSTAAAQNNLQLLSSYVIPGQRLSGCWHYTDSSGNEYALIGAEQGIVFLDITDPSQPDYLFQLPGNTSIWHEVKVSGNYAYAVSEGIDTNGVKNGVQVMDLRYLPDSVPYRFWQGDGLIFDQLKRAHSITADSNYIYVNGHDISTLGRGVLICSITDPWNPTFVGAIVNHYSHDCYVRNDRLYSSEILAGQFSVYDISNPSSPVLLASQTTPGAFNHNAWLNDAGTVIFTTDEQPNTPVASYDITDLSNITLLDEYFTEMMPSQEVHNVRVINDYLVNPSYGSQITVADASRPGNIVEIASYPTGSYLCWDADPYLASGAILATDMNSSTVFLFQPNYFRACYLEGLVTDSVTGVPVANVDVALSNTIAVKKSGIDGRYAAGNALAGTYTATFSKNGYSAKTISGITLTNGTVTNLDVQLAPSNIGWQEVAGAGGFFTFFPQPADETVWMHYSSKSAIDYSVSDLTGKILETGRLIPGETLRQSLNTAGLPSGFYTLKIQSASGIASGRLAVVH